MTPIEAGTKVRYYQPGVDSILASWSGSKPRKNDGEVREATVTSVHKEAGTTYYETAEGVLLTDGDLR